MLRHGDPPPLRHKLVPCGCGGSSSTSSTAAAATTGCPFVWAHPLTSSIGAEDRHRRVRLVRRCAASAAGSATTPAATAPRRPPATPPTTAGRTSPTTSSSCSTPSRSTGWCSAGRRWARRRRCTAPASNPIGSSALVLVIPPSAWETRTAQSKRYRSGARYMLTHGVHGFAKATKRLPEPADLRRPPRVPRAAAASAPSTTSTTCRWSPPCGAPPAPTCRRPRSWRRLRDIPTLILAWDTDPTPPGRPPPSGWPAASTTPTSTSPTPPTRSPHWPDEVAHFLADCE